VLSWLFETKFNDSTYAISNGLFASANDPDTAVQIPPYYYIGK